MHFSLVPFIIAAWYAETRRLLFCRSRCRSRCPENQRSLAPHISYTLRRLSAEWDEIGTLIERAYMYIIPRLVNLAQGVPPYGAKIPKWIKL